MDREIQNALYDHKKGLCAPIFLYSKACVINGTEYLKRLAKCFWEDVSILDVKSGFLPLNVV